MLLLLDYTSSRIPIIIIINKQYLTSYYFHYSRRRQRAAPGVKLQPRLRPSIRSYRSLSHRTNGDTCLPRRSSSTERRSTSSAKRRGHRGHPLRHLFTVHQGPRSREEIVERTCDRDATTQENSEIGKPLPIDAGTQQILRSHHQTQQSSDTREILVLKSHIAEDLFRSRRAQRLMNISIYSRKREN